MSLEIIIGKVSIVNKESERMGEALPTSLSNFFFISILLIRFDF